MSEYRSGIMKILDEEDAWDHVALHYIIRMRSEPYVKFKKDGTPDVRQNMARILKKLADLMDYDSSEQTITEETQ